MIHPKTPKPTKADEASAYELATLRDLNACQRCLRGGEPNRHHRKGRGVGGRTEVTNLLLLCGSGTTGCHGWATANPVEALRYGFSVPSWASPAEWPHKRWVRNRYNVLVEAWVIYTADGGWREITLPAALQIVGGVDAGEAAAPPAGDGRAA